MPQVLSSIWSCIWCCVLVTGFAHHCFTLSYVVIITHENNFLHLKVQLQKEFNKLKQFFSLFLAWTKLCIHWGTSMVMHSPNLSYLIPSTLSWSMRRRYCFACFFLASFPSTACRVKDSCLTFYPYFQVFPLDYCLFVAIVVYFLYCTMSGIRAISIRCCWIRVSFKFFHKLCIYFTCALLRRHGGQMTSMLDSRLSSLVSTPSQGHNICVVFLGKNFTLCAYLFW